MPRPSKLSRTARSLSAALAVLALGALAPAAASAADTVVTGTLLPGTLSLTTAPASTFSATLGGADQTATYTVPSTLTDARGTSAGWNLTITSTQFSTGGVTPSTLPTNASTITSVSNACLVTCTNPTNAVSYPVAVPAGSGPPTAVKYFNAATGTGAGTFTNTPTVGVAIPANAAAGAYTSTLTLSVVSGP
jgi:putative surface cell wall-binding protein